MSRFPVAFQPTAFASRSSDTRRGIGPSSRSAYRPTAGPRRGYRVPHARAATGLGASFTPGTTVLYPDRNALPGRRLPHLSDMSLHPAPASHLAGLRLTRHQRRFTQFTRPVFPSPVASRMERAALGLSPSFEPRRPEPDNARQGGDRPIEHGPETTLYDISRTSNPASFTRGVRPRVARRQVAATAGRLPWLHPTDGSRPGGRPLGSR